MSSSQEVVETQNPLEAMAIAANKVAAERAEPEETTDATQEKATETPIYLGGKKFSNVDELARYTAQLEQERSYAPVQQQQPAPQGRKASEVLFEDPDQAFQIHEQQIIAKIRAADEAKRQEEKLWSDFYSKNKDLDSERDVVQFALNKHWDELRGLHPDQATEKLAELSRNTIVRFKKTTGSKQDLPSGKAKVGPSATQAAPRIQEKQAAPVDFVTQLKKIQSKRK